MPLSLFPGMNRRTLTVIDPIVPLMGITGIAFVLSWLFHGQVISGLRDRHEDVWESLGSPGLFASNSVRSTLALRRYTRERRHLALQDVRLSRSIARRNWSERVYWAGLIACVYLVVVS